MDPYAKAFINCVLHSLYHNLVPVLLLFMAMSELIADNMLFHIPDTC